MDITGYGTCTWIFGDLPLAEIARRVTNLGYDGVELLGEIDKYSTAEVKCILNNRGLRGFSLTPRNEGLAIAQRGASAYEPDNTLCAFRRTIEHAISVPLKVESLWNRNHQLLPDANVGIGQPIE